jgi:hypothetical protein
MNSHRPRSLFSINIAKGDDERAEGSDALIELWLPIDSDF